MRALSNRLLRLALLVFALAVAGWPSAARAQLNCVSGETQRGIDVSQYQGSIDWNAVRASGVVFGIARISDGVYPQDPYFASNWSAMKNAGIIRGAYQFFRANEDLVTQANMMVQKVGRLGPGDLPATLDVELFNGVDPGTVAAKIAQWLDIVERGTGKTPMIYTGYYAWQGGVGSSAFGRYPLWIAAYGSCPRIPPGWNGWTIWQYSSTGSVPGIGGYVDMNLFQGSYTQLQALAGQVVNDADGDGYPAGIDCNDGNPGVHPGAGEQCNNADDNCNGQVDEGVVQACGSDVGECTVGTRVCAHGAWSQCSGTPPAAEACDGRDNNCDGQIDDGEVCEREEMRLGQASFAPDASSDIDGDGKADACAAVGSELRCFLSAGGRFRSTAVTSALTLDDGRSAPASDRSTRLGDLNGDGWADVCLQAGGRLTCWLGGSNGFAQRVSGPKLPDMGTNPEYMNTLAMQDFNGDGRYDLCLRTPEDFRCYPSSGGGFGPPARLPEIADQRGLGRAHYYGTIRMGDVDGDGRADVCARGPEGMDCWLSSGVGFPTKVRGPAWSDATGWAALHYWSTIRLIDVNGDRRADLCGRASKNFLCYLSSGQSFAELVVGPPLSDTEGWADRSRYTTIRMGDVNGDGAADVCARSAERFDCWLWTGHGFDQRILGPELSDQNGWARPEYYRTLRLADLNGDRRVDVCARGIDGLSCWLSDGRGFSTLILGPRWRDADGWQKPELFSALHIAGPTPARLNVGGQPIQAGCSLGRGASLRAATWLPLLGFVVLLARLRRRSSR